MKRVWKYVFCVLLLVACGRSSPTGSSPMSSVPNWSPYIGVHTYSIFQNIQQPHMQPLIDAGVWRGARIDIDSADAEYFAGWVSAQGIDVLAIFPNEYLRDSNVWDALSAKMRRNPGVRYWEIGNELDIFTDISISEYMPIFVNLVRRAAEEFPDNVLIAQAPCGCTGGASLVGEMLDQGLLRLAQEGRLPVLAVHYYSAGSMYLSKLKRHIQRLPGSTQVWVTETGIGDQSRHLDFVATEYPRMRAQLRATRIYWYAFSECTDFSLVGGLPEPCKLEKPKLSPLYQALTLSGGDQ